MPARRSVRSTDGRLKANRPTKAVSKPKSRWQQLLDGELTPADLDDDEIMAGRTKNSQGSFGGVPPGKMPRQLLDAMRVEFQVRVQTKFESYADTAIQTLVEVAQNRHAAAPARVRAAEVLLERAVGKVPDKVMASVEVNRIEGVVEGMLVDITDEPVHKITTLEE